MNAEPPVQNVMSTAELAVFRAQTEADIAWHPRPIAVHTVRGLISVPAHVWRCFAVHPRLGALADRFVDLTHVPTGRRIASFLSDATAQGAAMKAYALADWWDFKNATPAVGEAFSALVRTFGGFRA